MPLPRWVARLNARFINRLAAPMARRLQREYAVVHHRGRSTGRWHRTPLLVFPRGRSRFVALTYGPAADWVRNVLAGPAFLEERGDTRRTIVDPEITDREAGWDVIGPVYRLVLRLLRVRLLLRFEVGDGTETPGNSPRL